MNAATGTVDHLDRCLVHALQVDGRAPFRRIGDILGVSDQTVARRYARLRSSHELRVLGLAAPAAVNDAEWVLRIRVAPTMAADVGEALARRSDTSWISLCDGGNDIVASAYGSDIERLLLDKLPQNRGVLDVHAHQVLQVFYGGAGQPFTKSGPLPESAVAELARESPARADVPSRLDPIDRRIVGQLRRDGRAGLEALAIATSSSASTVRRRVDELRRSGVLHFDVDVHLDLFNLPVRTMFWLSVDPDQVGRTGRALATHACVAFAAATTGRTNLYASVATPDASTLWNYATTTVALLPGVRAIEMQRTLRCLKAAATVFVRKGPIAQLHQMTE